MGEKLKRHRRAPSLSSGSGGCWRTPSTAWQCLFVLHPWVAAGVSEMCWGHLTVSNSRRCDSFWAVRRLGEVRLTVGELANSRLPPCATFQAGLALPPRIELPGPSLCDQEGGGAGRLRAHCRSLGQRMRKPAGGVTEILEPAVQKFYSAFFPPPPSFPKGLDIHQNFTSSLVSCIKIWEVARGENTHLKNHGWLYREEGTGEAGRAPPGTRSGDSRDSLWCHLWTLGFLCDGVSLRAPLEGSRAGRTCHVCPSSAWGCWMLSFSAPEMWDQYNLIMKTFNYLRNTSRDEVDWA